MRVAFYQHSASPHRASFRRRAVSFVLALAVNILMVTALLTLAPAPSRPPEAKREPVTFQLLPEPQAAAKRARTIVKRVSGGAPRRRPAPVVAPIAPVGPLKMMIVSREMYAASDIAKMPSHRDENADGEGAGADADGGAADGAGPGGERLYNAEWYRKPTNAELDYYIPAGAPRTGWGVIACRTVAHYQVEDCRELGESPAGSGFARAVRLAAWQFRVLPPRIGGRAMVGQWVSIRIDYIEGVVKP